MAETFVMGTVENFRWERGDMVANRLFIQFKIRGGDFRPYDVTGSRRGRRLRGIGRSQALGMK